MNEKDEIKLPICCGKQQDGPFCPSCGTRLVKNPFIGRGEYSLQQEIERLENNLRFNSVEIEKIQRRHTLELADVLRDQKNNNEELNYVREALDFARTNSVGIAKEVR